ncbi:MAG TPA: hypothetical protein VFQ80_14085 [Thermomicrobiales bacterium]|nr:hypothetical protein [Thermomicrobiales bacterium]
MRESQARRLDERLRLKLTELDEGRIVNVSSRLIIGGRILLQRRPTPAPEEASRLLRRRRHWLGERR